MVEKLGTLPAGRISESIAIGTTRIFVGTSRDTELFTYKGDVFALPKSGGTPTVFVADAGTQTRLAVDSEELYLFAAYYRSGSDDLFRVEHVDGTGTRKELAPTASFLNCTDVAFASGMIYLACLGAQPSSGPWPSTVRRLSKTGGALETVGEMDTVYNVDFSGPWVYWISIGTAGIQRRRVDLSTPLESLTAVEYHGYRGIDAASSTAWWSAPGGVKRYDWSTKTSSVFATGENCGIAARAGAAVWRTCGPDYKPKTMHFVPAGGGEITSWVSSASGPMTLDADYIYYVESADVVRVRRPDR